MYDIIFIVRRVAFACIEKALYNGKSNPSYGT